MGFLSNCNCIKKIPTSGGTAETLGCICFKPYRNLCSKGPEPCGDTFQVDLSEQVSNTINDGDEVFSLYEVPAEGVSGLTLEPDGLLEITTDGYGSEEVTITVKVCTEKGGKEYCSFGDVIICFKDLCKGVVCDDGDECNECTGECESAEADLEI